MKRRATSIRALVQAAVLAAGMFSFASVRAAPTITQPAPPPPGTGDNLYEYDNEKAQMSIVNLNTSTLVVDIVYKPATNNTTTVGFAPVYNRYALAGGRLLNIIAQGMDRTLTAKYSITVRGGRKIADQTSTFNTFSPRNLGGFPASIATSFRQMTINAN